MKKVVTTSMSEDGVSVSLRSSESESSGCFYHFPVKWVNPRIALQIATLLTSDPTVPQNESKEE